LSSRTLARGDVVLRQFPFTDLSGSRIRPAVVVSHGQIGDDVVLAAISSLGITPKMEVLGKPVLVVE
jgi:mRNA interferase MazF